MGKLVIFLPGMGGSVLVNSKTNKRLYPSTKINNLLNSETDAKSFNILLANSVTARGPVLSVVTTTVYSNLFDTLVSKGFKLITEDHLSDKKYKIKPNLDYVLGFGWNWIKSHSFSDNVTNLNRIVTLWRERTYKEPIVGLCHSSGALLAMYVNGIFPNSFNKIIAVDSPLNGTQEAFELITLGECRFSPPGLSQAQLWQLAQQESSCILYELLSNAHLVKLSHSNYPGIVKSKVARAQRFRDALFSGCADLIIIIPSTTIFTEDELVPSCNNGKVRVTRITTKKPHSLLFNSTAILKAICDNFD